MPAASVGQSATSSSESVTPGSAADPARDDLAIRLDLGHRPGPVGGSLVLAGLGILFALAGMMARGAGLTSDFERMGVHWVDWLARGALEALTIAAGLFLWMILPRFSRRRRKKDDEFEHVYEPPPLSPATVVTLILLMLAPMGAIGYLLWSGNIDIALSDGLFEPGKRVAQPVSPLAPETTTTAPMVQAHPSGSAPLVDTLVSALALLAALAGLALVLWLQFGGRLHRTRADVSGPPSAPAMLSGAVEDSLDALRREPDVRAAIIKCYRRFEEALASAQQPRDPWQTPGEFMRSVLRRFPLPKGAVSDLTRLFEISRFSNHAMNDEQRERAWQSLLDIRSAVNRGKPDD